METYFKNVQFNFKNIKDIVKEIKVNFSNKPVRS